MLISPPFLPARQADESEDDWLDRCMSGGQPGDGAFPLSLNLGWHGGLHLIAPMNGDQPEPVRAIADGTIVFVRAPTPQPAGPLPPEHPLAYRGRWTDNGVVVLRHETEIGEGVHGQVVFFSICMHLSAIHPAVVAGRTIYRKAELGTAGQIYGELQRRIHFEIVCDDANLRALVGRTAGELPTDADGRLDAVYGQMYFVLPGGTTFYDRKPLDHLAAAHIQPPKPSAQAALPQALQAAHTSAADAPLVVALRYAGGEGAAGHRGSAFLSTLRPDGTGLGETLEEADAEYELYTRANAISSAYPANARPAPSAVYELLRFGRVVNTAHETLTPADVPHWREVRHPGGQGWVNLNAPGVRKFSDADFPHWQRWQLIDDSADQDSRCDSPTLKGWLDFNGDGQIGASEATSRLADAALAPRLARTICKFPTEWDAAAIDQRWGWLKTSTPENPHPFPDADFELLRAHIRALAFFPGGTGLPANHWHFQPREFVRQFRRCGWLSPRETRQCIPRNSPAGLVPLATANARAAEWGTAVNKMSRKFNLDGRARLTHLLAQVWAETGYLRTTREGGADGATYAPYIGRGLIQITWRDKYEDYQSFAGLDNSFNIELIATDTHHAGNSSGFYWVSKGFKEPLRHSSINLSRLADGGLSTDCIGKLCLWINGGGNHYDHRHIHCKFIDRILSDAVFQISPAIEQANFNKMEFVRETVIVNGHPVRRIIGTQPSSTSMTIRVDHTPQR